MSQLNAHLYDKEFETQLRIFPTNMQCDEHNMEILQNSSSGHISKNLCSENRGHTS